MVKLLFPDEVVSNSAASKRSDATLHSHTARRRSTVSKRGCGSGCCELGEITPQGMASSTASSGINDLAGKIRAINEAYRKANLGISIVQRGRRLYLRATLPPKPWSKQSTNYQQDIATGVYANPAGLKTAEKMARKVAGDLSAGTFNWEPYLRRRRPDQKTFGGLIEEFRTHFLHYGKSKAKEQRWECIYRTLKLLPTEERFSMAKLEEWALKIIESIPTSASKQKATNNLKQFINFLKKVEIDDI